MKAEVLNKGVEEKAISSVTGLKKLLSSTKKVARMAEEKRTILQQKALLRSAASLPYHT